jgi:hypothetical protein
MKICVVKLGQIVNGWGYWACGGYLPRGRRAGGVTLDRGGNVHGLEGVRELENELGRFKEVLYLAWGRGRGGLSGGCERDR